MTTQRDRLTAALKAASSPGEEREFVDALLAQGVRVVDLDILASAVAYIGGDRLDDCEECRACAMADAEDILGTLDSEL